MFGLEQTKHTAITGYREIGVCRRPFVENSRDRPCLAIILAHSHRQTNAIPIAGWIGEQKPLSCNPLSCNPNDTAVRRRLWESVVELNPGPGGAAVVAPGVCSPSLSMQAAKRHIDSMIAGLGNHSLFGQVFVH